MKQSPSLGVLIVVMILACVAWGIVHEIADNDCKKRGGHLEWIYGRHISFTCDGAVR